MILWMFIILHRIIQLYMLAMIITAVLSWVVMLNLDYKVRTNIYKVQRFLSKLTDPVLRYIDKYIPPVQLGNINLSISFIILFVAVSMLDSFVYYLEGLYVLSVIGPFGL